MKEFLFHIKKRILAFYHLQIRQLKRLLANVKLNEEESFKVPIVINNYNHFTYLKNMVSWLVDAGYTNIYVLDNDSTYPPLLEYYKTCPAKIIFLKKNRGFKALWQIELFNELKKNYYVYTDSDVIPNTTCPKNCVFKLYQLSKKYACEKIGPALQLDDLPNHYALKETVKHYEAKHWQLKLADNIYDAPIDTTFALYKPYAFGAAEECKGIRVAGNLLFKHLPWYIDTNNLNEEELFYKSTITKGATMWSEKN